MSFRTTRRQRNVEPTPAARPSRAPRMLALLSVAVTAGLGLPLVLSTPASAAPLCTPSGAFTSCAYYGGADENQTFIVPKGVDSIHAVLDGSGGGASTFDGLTGGRGGTAAGTVAVIAGQVLNLTVGTTTWGGGGAPGEGSRGTAGRGGGLTALWDGEPFTGTPLLLAGGGGGASGAGAPNPSGGDGGGTEGAAGNSVSGSQYAGSGGTQVSGGAGGLDGGTAGSQYQGGDGSDGADSGGGGGAGWFGGGGGHGQISEDDANNDGGGGGGSGYLGLGVTDGSLTSGTGGDPGDYGTVVLEWVAPAPTIDEPTDGSTTADSTPTISGTGIPGGTISVRVDDADVTCVEGSPAPIAESGSWSCTPTEPLLPGTYSLRATQHDPAAPQATYPRSAANEVTIAEAAAPGAPRDLTAAAGDSSLELTFGSPASDGGAAVTGYEYSLDGETWVALPTTGTGPFSAAVEGLTNGESYVVQVRAVNSVGAGPAAEAEPVTPVAPVTVPGAPEDLTITPGDGSVALSFGPPASDGGSAVTGYEYSLDGTTWLPLTTTGTGPFEATIEGLGNGQSYAIQVRAVNAVGGGVEVASVVASPTAPTTSSTSTSTSTTTGTSTTTPPSASDQADLAYTGVSGMPTLLASSLALLLGGGLLLILTRRGSFARMRRH